MSVAARVREAQRALGAAGPVARYFPVQRGRYEPRPGLYRLGHDFGNGSTDDLWFQLDETAPRWLQAKQQGTPPPRAGFAGSRADDHERLDALAERVERRLEQEHPGWLDRATAWNEPRPELTPVDARWDRLALSVQEDLAVVRRDGGGDRLALLHVCFPSGWAPERIHGADFARVHAPVPGFPTGAPARKLVEAMLMRGPYVRFVWTLSADDWLDHHPVRGARRSFEHPEAAPFLRVERQVLLPFPDLEAALFLIRTYVTPADELTEGERATLRDALDGMGTEFVEYKGLRGAGELLRNVR